LNSTAVSLNDSMSSLRSFATDPRLKNNLLATVQSVSDTTHNLALLTSDLRTVTADPQTQAQLRNTVANLDATLQKANSLLGSLGGTSSVYGVDAGATPAPAVTVPGATPFPNVPPGAAAPESGLSPATRARLHAKLGGLMKNLVNLQIRLSGLSPMHSPGLNPVMTNSQGPLGDLNLVVLPHGSTSLMVGANAIGNNTTWNAVLEKRKGALQLGAGVLYSQIGVLGRYEPAGGLGFETRVYDLTYPMLDMYGTFRIAPGAELFFGQRDITHASRRNTAGLQYQF
jgi:hypothetical protein